MRPLSFYSSVLKKILTQTYMIPSRTNYLSTEKQAKERTFMAKCDECDCYDDNYIDGEDITEEELENDHYMNPIAIITGMGTYKKIIRCQQVMIVYASVASVIS